MSFAKNIKKLREDKGLTQVELAKLTGISQPMLAQYERGIKTPGLLVGIEIAKKLGTTCEDLVK